MSLATRDQFHWEVNSGTQFWKHFGKGEIGFLLIGKCSSGALFWLECVMLYVHIYGPESLLSLWHSEKMVDKILIFVYQ